MDTLLTNGTVLTMDASGTVAEAVAFSGGRIEAVGEAADLRRRLSPETEVVDLAGATVCPGFIDGHNHFSPATFEAVQVDCSTPPLGSLAEVLEAIRAHTGGQPRDRWLRGWGFHSSRVRERRNPTRWELDEASPANPFVLMDASYHACHVNSAALAACRITAHSPDPGAGRIVRDRRGLPTGTLLENAMDLPQSASWLDYVARSPDGAVGMIEANCERHLALGITGVGDALVIPQASELYRRAAEAGRLPLTIHQMHGGESFFATPRIDRRWAERALEDHGRMLRGGTLKLFMDTVYPGPAIDHCEDGIPDVHRGRNYYGAAEAEELVRTAAGRGLEVSIHCLGNCALRQALDAYAAVRRSSGGLDRRLRVEHFIIASQDQVRRTAELDVVVMMQPVFAQAWGDMYVDEWRGSGQPQLGILPMRSLLDAGVTVAASSDYPCATLSPLEGMWSAVTRRGPNGEPVDPDEAVSPLEALRAYTVSAAIACGRLGEEGTLEPGKRANLAVLDGNPLTCGHDQLRSLSVVRTYVDGACRYRGERKNGHQT